jgi:hypothetical protein
MRKRAALAISSGLPVLGDRGSRRDGDERHVVVSTAIFFADY